MSENKYFLSPLITDYLDFLKNIKGLSKNTISSYLRDLNKFSNILRWYKEIASREAVIKGYDVPSMGAEIPIP